MSVFNAGGAYTKNLPRSETTIDSFLNRASARLSSLSGEHAETIKKLVDPASMMQPLSLGVILLVGGGAFINDATGYDDETWREKRS